jgi:hypothetical protein
MSYYGKNATCPADKRGEAAEKREEKYFIPGTEHKRALNQIVHCDPKVNPKTEECPIYQQNKWALEEYDDDN